MTFLWLMAACLTGHEDRFLTEEEALRVIFGDAEIVRAEIVLEKSEKESIESRLGRSVEDRFVVHAGRRNGTILGYAVITEEIGKYLPITFIVGIDPKGKVIDTAVMVHREPIGADCRRRSYLDQIQGKGVDDPIRQNRDLLVVEGATLSCNGVARGVRKVVAVVDTVCLRRPGFADGLFQEEVREQRLRMGTLCTVVAKGTGARAAVDAAFAEIQRLEKILSDYDDESELSRLNRKGEANPEPDLRRFLQESLRYAKETGGAFDPSVGAVVDAWGFRSRKHRVPSGEELARLVVGWERIEFAGGKVTIPSGMRLDPGAIGKGFAVDRAVEVLRKSGIPEGMVDFGSTVFAFGREWEVGVRDPFRPEEVLGTIALKDEAMAVSGSYENRFESGGKWYGHILDPRTRRPVESVAGTAVLAPTATEADVYSTAVFVDPALAAGRPALVIPSDAEGECRATKEWTRRFRERK